MMVRVRVCVDDATRFVNEALREFKAGVNNNDMIKVRDAAKKAWDAVVQVTNALILILYYLGKTPSSHWERRRLLSELEKTEPKIEGLGFRDRYSAKEKNLHETIFYEGLVDIDEAEFKLEKARRYVDDVKKLLGL
jgi:hypothetical protein